MGKSINMIILVLGICMILYYLALGLCVRFGQSLMFVWPIMGALCIGRYIYWHRAYATGALPAAAPVTILRILFACALLFFLIVEGVIFAGGRIAAPDGCDYVIVLGAQVNPDGPSGALRNRTNAAYEYLAAHPDARAVLSGGQGANEPMSEAACMYELLTQRGISPDRLILEERSTDTRENLVNSFALIDDDAASVALVTNDFHMLRARGIARRLGRDVGGVSVPTSAISFPHYMVREFVGVLHEYIRGTMAF